MMQFSSRMLLAALATTAVTAGAHAAAVFSNNGTTAPTIGAGDTGWLGPFDGRFGWDGPTEDHGQSFTLASAGTLDSIYFAYNEFGLGETITFDLTVSDSTGVVYTETGITLSGDDYEQGGATDTFWIEIDLSSENIAMAAGTGSFVMEGVADTGDSWALAPLYTTGDPYAGGNTLGLANNGTNDSLFAVTTTVPEPGSLALLGLGGLAVLRRRR